jgi:hypothetical protein
MTLSWSTYCPTADVMGPGGPGYCSFVSLLHVIRMQPTKGSKPIFIILHLLSSHFIEQKPWRNSKKTLTLQDLIKILPLRPQSFTHDLSDYLQLSTSRSAKKNKYQTRLPRVCYGHKSYPSFHEVKKSTVGPVELASPSQNHS